MLIVTVIMSMGLWVLRENWKEMLAELTFLSVIFFFLFSSAYNHDANLITTMRIFILCRQQTAFFSFPSDPGQLKALTQPCYVPSVFVVNRHEVFNTRNHPSSVIFLPTSSRPARNILKSESPQPASEEGTAAAVPPLWSVHFIYLQLSSPANRPLGSVNS